MNVKTNIELPADFDPEMYLSLNQDVREAGIDPITHYLEFGFAEQRQYKKKDLQALLPPDFNAEDYLELNPDVASAHLDPVTHYIEFGCAEQRQYKKIDSQVQLPPDFNAEHYLELNPDVASAHLDPVAHFLEFGHAENRQWIITPPPDLPDDFIPRVYLLLNPDVKTTEAGAIQHYLNFGVDEQREYAIPGITSLPQDFDAEAYKTLNPDVRETDIDPLLHYLRWGRHEGRVYSLNTPSRRPATAKPMYFMHIPKTAGSSVNSFAREQMVCAFHIENLPEIYTAIEQKRANFDFVSGHVGVRDNFSIARSDDWYKFTFLRHPIQQTISHLKWVRSYSTPERESELVFYSDEHKVVFQAMKNISLNDVETLDRLWQSNYKFRSFFDNCQVRYLIDSDNVDFIDEDYFNIAMEEARVFDYIAFCETASQDSAKILQQAGWPVSLDEFPTVNISPSNEMPDLDDPTVLAFYQKLTHYDMRLYEHFWNNRKG